MATLSRLSDEDVSAEALAVFAEIRQARKTDFINGFWRALAHDPKTLRATWDRLSEVMQDGALDPLTKELIYIAVSATNGCSYCVHSHTASARAKGMTEAQYAELLAVIGMAAETNALATAMQVPVDPEFLDD